LYLLFIFALAIHALTAEKFMSIRYLFHTNTQVKPAKAEIAGNSLHFIAQAAFFGWVGLCIQGCAKVGSPTGGPRDLNPPAYVSGVPENRTVNFQGTAVDITFDEYIQLKNERKEVTISPPMKEKPLVRLREKTLRVTFEEKLQPLTTYTLNFGNAITDLNEGNILPDFEYVISTGDHIDSLSVTGKVVNAFNHQPDKDASIVVMLYENRSDSAPLKEMPKYYSKVSKHGLFAINNIHAGSYRVIALKDANNNMMYNPVTEKVAFLDSFLIVNPGSVKPETFIKDTVKIIVPPAKQAKGHKQDSVKAHADTLIAPGRKLNAVNVSMTYFQEEASRVFITSKTRETRECFSIAFNRPLYDTLQLKLLNIPARENWMIRESKDVADSMVYWITDTLLTKHDTLKLRLSYLTTDSVGHLYERADTLSLRYLPKLKKGAVASRKEKTAEPPVEAVKAGERDSVEIQDRSRHGGIFARKDEKPKQTTVKKQALKLLPSVASRGTLDLNAVIMFTSEKPIQKLNPENIELWKYVDSVATKQKFVCETDTSSTRRFMIRSKWDEDCQYRILLKPGTAQDIYGLQNDTLEIRFVTQKEDYYGRILVTLTGSKFPLLVQVLDEKDKVVTYKEVMKEGLITFDYLYPQKFTLKAVYDKNGNGKWDTGNYLKHIQPEKVYLYDIPARLRSNCDYEITWNILEE
jgi:hypothetical protein